MINFIHGGLYVDSQDWIKKKKKSKKEDDKCLL